MRVSVVGPCDVTRWSLVDLDGQETNLIEIQVDLHFK